MKQTLLSLLLMAVIGVAFNAKAATVSSNTTHTASVVASCTLATPSNLIFGKYDPLVTHRYTSLDSVGQLDISCTQGASMQLWVNMGAAGDCMNNRAMRNGAMRMNYQIYRNSSRSEVWAGFTDSCGGTRYGLTSSSSTAAQSVMVYGRIPSGQSSVAAGTYVDTLTWTLSF